MSARITAATVIQSLEKSGSNKAAQAASRFIKVGKGQYGEGDQFLGVRMPVIRKLAQESVQISLIETARLLKNAVHEVRMVALLILVEKFQQGDELLKEKVVTLYLNNTPYINGWDLVDCSAHLITGPWFLTRDKKNLTTLARSESLWERRIAIISTFHFIRQNQYTTTLQVALILLKDKEDLIHKAVGWMLREVGNRDRALEETFLKQHYQKMPRTMLRYAIEKFPETLRLAYLKGTV